MGFHVGRSWYWYGHVHSLDFKGLGGKSCFKISISKDICRYLTEEKDKSLGEELHST